MIKTFVVEDLNIKELADSRIFRNDKSNMKVLNLDDVKIDFDEALKIMDNIKNQKYKRKNPKQAFENITPDNMAKYLTKQLEEVEKF